MRFQRVGVGSRCWQGTFLYVSLGLTPPEKLSEAVAENRSAVCWRQTTDGRNRCGWHAERVAREDGKTVGDGSVVVLDGANVDELRSNSSLEGVACRYANFSEADLEEVDFSEADLRGADLSEAHLEGADLSGASFYESELSGAVLRRADLSKANLHHVDLSQAKLQYANLSQVDLQYVNLSQAKLRRADLSEAKLDSVDLSQANLQYVNFLQSNLQRVNFPKAHFYDVDLPEADFEHADFSGADFEHADLSGADFEDADFSGADFYDVDLSGAGFEHADLSEADFEHADPPEADLRRADLSNGDRHRACLLGANLSNTTAKSTNFRDTTFGDPDTDHSSTNLENAVFRDADLRGADFTDAKLDQIDLTDARIDAKTSFDAETIYEDDDGVTSDQREGKGDTAPPSVWVHRQLEQLHEENALSSVARKFHIRKQRARKRHYAAEANVGGWRELIPDHSLDRDTLQTKIGTLRDRFTREAITSRAGDIRDRLTREEIRDQLQNAGGRLTRLGRRLRGNPVRKLGKWVRGRRDWQAYVRWLQLRTFEVTMGYGERPSRVIGMAAACVVGCALLYPLGNWVVPNPGSVEAAQRGLNSDVSGDTAVDAAVDAAVRYPSLPNNLAAIPSYLDGLASTLADSIYFSTVTFTTLGFGDFSPVGFGRVLATVESALGVTLFAVLVFVLGRRATR